MDELKSTALHDLHLELGARMVPFTGYEMPVQYNLGIKHEHLHTRTQAGLFDISHMGQIKIHGEDAARNLERLVPSDIQELGIHQQRYTVLTNDSGGIIDDIMVTKATDHLFLVVNAACKEKDIAHLKAGLESDNTVEVLDNRSLLALQGPKAAEVLRQYTPDIDQLSFMQAGNFEIDGIYCFINRCGYTGEDGFEISVYSSDAASLARTLLANDAVEMIGLGARDTLRLEAGLCLYGHDIDEETTPIEADLAWVVAKKYRKGDISSAQFPGATKILAQLKQGTETIRTGFLPEGKAPVREGAMLMNDKDEGVGRITSGGYGQTVGGPIAMGYLLKSYAAPDTKLKVVIRDREHILKVTTLPFVEHRYYKP